MEEKKRTSETLRQREKAQRDLLELKKMQAGELDPGPKPSEVEQKPKTIGQKADNFWYHHKVSLIVGALLIAALGLLVYQQATRIRYDGTLVVYGQEEYLEAHTQKMGEYIARFYPDTNENGRVDIAVADCAYNPQTTPADLAGAKQTKLQVSIASDEGAMLYLLDADAVAYLKNTWGDYDFFREENLIELSDDFYNAMQTENVNFVERGLYLGLRSIEDTTLQGAAEDYEQVKQAFEAIRAANGK